MEKQVFVNAAPAPGNGRTALQAASEGGHIAVVERLLEKGADVNAAPGYYGIIALQIASRGGQCEIAERLRKAGATKLGVVTSLSPPTTIVVQETVAIFESENTPY